MSDARPKGFKKSGGGFLNNVDAVILDYAFTDNAFDDGEKSKKSKNSDAWQTMHGHLTVRVDGSEDNSETHVFAGNGLMFEITEDGRVLQPVEDGNSIGSYTAWAALMNGLVESGFPEEKTENWYSEKISQPIDFNSIINARVHFVQEKDEEATKKLGKRKGKDGKDYDRTRLAITAFYGFEESKKAGKAVAGKPGPKGKASKSSEPDVTDIATEALKRYLSAAEDNTLGKSKVRMKLLTDKEFKGQTELRTQVETWLAKQANLDTLVEAEVIVVDGNNLTLVG